MHSVRTYLDAQERNGVEAKGLPEMQESILGYIEKKKGLTVTVRLLPSGYNR